MLSAKCANPDCTTAFDYHEGHFFRFPKAHPASEEPPNTHCVQHFWLCGKCCKHHTLVYVEGGGVVLEHRLDVPADFEEPRFVAAA